MGKRAKRKPLAVCSWCGVNDEEVCCCIIAGPGDIAICCQCIELGANIVIEYQERKRSQKSLEEAGY